MNANDIIADKYVVQNKIGSGKFGTVFKCINKKTKEFVAIKTENSRTSLKILKHETSILKYIYDHGVREVPLVYWYGVHDIYTCLAMTHYDCSLQEYLLNKENLPISKINSLIVICINILESIHKVFILHRDIKPHNFMIKGDQIFLIDFGFATFFVDERSNHLPISSHENILGTPKYVSYYVHDGSTPSRRDDIISLGYMYLFLICRELPWDSFKKPDYIENLDEINIMHYKNQQRKTHKSIENISAFCKQINPCAYEYFNISYKLDYHAAPNYDLLRTLLPL
jgi:serine/threonine protein kinase